MRNYKPPHCSHCDYKPRKRSLTPFYEPCPRNVQMFQTHASISFCTNKIVCLAWVIGSCAKTNARALSPSLRYSQHKGVPLGFCYNAIMFTTTIVPHNPYYIQGWCICSSALIAFWPSKLTPTLCCVMAQRTQSHSAFQVFVFHSFHPLPWISHPHFYHSLSVIDLLFLYQYLILGLTFLEGQLH